MKKMNANLGTMTINSDELDLIGMKNVKVVTPCTCGAKRWFQCHCATPVAEYEVMTFDTVPNAAQLAHIREQHPGMTLIY